MRRSGILATAAWCALLAGISVGDVEGASAAPASAGAPEQGVTEVSIRGSLGYRERAALPPDSVAVVELWEAPRPDAAPRLGALAYSRQELRGKQVPIPFTVPVQRGDVSEGRDYLLRAAILISGRPVWITRESLPVKLTSGVVDVGTVSLAAANLPPPRTLRCGDRTAFVRAGEVAELTAGPRRYILYPAVSASGVRYLGGSTPATSFFAKGERATLAVAGQQWEECSVEPFRAHGNEPSWALEIGTRLRFKRGELGIEAPTPPVQLVGGTARYEAKSEDQRLTVAVSERACVDGMSGMPYPHTVEVTTEGATYAGCGGEPLALLQGAEWVVTDIEGAAPGRRLTLDFGADGRAFGQGPCNLYNAGYVVTGESLGIAPGTTALKRCEPALMQQEGQFFNQLGKTQRFEIESDGALVLHASDGRKMTARAVGLP